MKSRASMTRARALWVRTTTPVKSRNTMNTAKPRHLAPQVSTLSEHAAAVAVVEGDVATLPRRAVVAAGVDLAVLAVLADDAEVVVAAGPVGMVSSLDMDVSSLLTHKRTQRRVWACPGARGVETTMGKLLCLATLLLPYPVSLDVWKHRLRGKDDADMNTQRMQQLAPRSWNNSTCLRRLSVKLACSACSM